MNDIITITSLLLLFAMTNVLAEDCNCTSYPFTPNPPCFSECVESLVTGKKNISDVSNLDKKVAKAIKALSESASLHSIDFGNIENELDLKQALESLDK